MTDRVVIVPGFGADPQRHWFPWLADHARRRGATVEIVALPDPLTPRRADWERATAAAVGEPDGATWIVAHSLGCITALRALGALEGAWRLGGLLLVAGFSGSLASLPELDGYLAEPAPTRHVRERTDRRVALSSDDDPVVPTAATAQLAAQLDARLLILPGRGHFTEETGVRTLPEALAQMFLPPPR
jgi:predicted alpha/beta hydrolase family esterase